MFAVGSADASLCASQIPSIVQPTHSLSHHRKSRCCLFVYITEKHWILGTILILATLIISNLSHVPTCSNQYRQQFSGAREMEVLTNMSSVLVNTSSVGTELSSACMLRFWFPTFCKKCAKSLTLPVPTKQFSLKFLAWLASKFPHVFPFQQVHLSCMLFQEK